MYEDVRIELDAFATSHRVFSIASAGCTALALAQAGHDVVACDINPVQLAYAQARLCEGRPPITGAADRAMALLRRLAPLGGWHKSLVREFLHLQSPADQTAFWQEHLNTWRFRTAFDAILSPALLRFVYSKQLLDCLPPHFGAAVRQRMERCFARHANSTNPYAQALLAGEFPAPARVPSSSRVEFVHSDAASYLESCEAGEFDAFTLSNILDGAAPNYQQRLRRAIGHAGSPDALVVIRSFGDRSYGGEQHAADDRSMLWGAVEVVPAQVFSAGAL